MVCNFKNYFAVHYQKWEPYTSPYTFTFWFKFCTQNTHYVSNKYNQCLWQCPSNWTRSLPSDWNLRLTASYYIIAATVSFTGYRSYFAHYEHSPASVLSLTVYLPWVPQHPPLDWCRSSWRRDPWSIWSDCTAELQAASAEILEKSWSRKDIFYYIMITSY